MKNKNNIIDEEDLDDEVKKNTDKNVQLGKDLCFLHVGLQRIQEMNM